MLTFEISKVLIAAKEGRSNEREIDWNRGNDDLHQLLDGGLSHHRTPCGNIHNRDSGLNVDGHESSKEFG